MDYGWSFGYTNTAQQQRMAFKHATPARRRTLVKQQQAHERRVHAERREWMLKQERVFRQRLARGQWRDLKTTPHRVIAHAKYVNGLKAAIKKRGGTSGPES